MKIPLLDLKAQYVTIKDEVKSAIDEVLESQYFILGPKVQKLEEEIAKYSGCKYGVGVSSGTDAILLAIMALDIGAGDIVITTDYTFFSTAGCIARLGAKPMFVDIEQNTFNIDPVKLQQLLENMSENELKKVKAVIPVHLFGQMADMEKIMPICKKYNLKVIEDAAQAIGAECMFNDEVRRAGSIGDIGCFSFFPSKNLGGIGDGGMIVTNDEDLYNKMKLLRSHGAKPKYYHKCIGGNFRLDEIQAAVLLVKLKYLDEWTKKRQENADKYNEYLREIDSNKLTLPSAVNQKPGVKNYHIYNQYCICTKDRDQLKDYLSENGVGSEVYYPQPMHMQECFGYLGYKEGDFINSEILAKNSLAMPIYPELNIKEIERAAQLIKTYIS